MPIKGCALRYSLSSTQSEMEIIAIPDIPTEGELLQVSGGEKQRFARYKTHTDSVITITPLTAAHAHQVVTANRFSDQLSNFVIRHAHADFVVIFQREFAASKQQQHHRHHHGGSSTHGFSPYHD